MAGVIIDSGPVAASDFLREVPPEKWFDLMQVRKSFLRINLPYDCRSLLQFVEDSEQMYAPLGFTSPEDFIERGLQLDPQDVAWAVEGLRRMKPNEAIPYEKAKALGKQGRPKKGEEKGADGTLKRGSNNADYITARLERDGHHALAEKVRSKAMSARAAAIEAGIITPPTPLDQIRKLYVKLTPDDQETFRKEIGLSGGW